MTEVAVRRSIWILLVVKTREAYPIVYISLLNPVPIGSKEVILDISVLIE